MIDLRSYENLHAIQMLKGIIRRWWNLELAFADATGYVLDHAEGRLAPPNNVYCGLALGAKEGFLRCQESLRMTRDRLRIETLRREAARPTARRCVVHECHLGFDLVGCPIVLDGELAGLLFVGGSVRERVGRTAEQTLLRKLRELGAPAAGIDEDAARALPLLDEAALDRLCDLLEFGADEIKAAHAAMKRRAPREGGEREGEEPRRFGDIIGASRPMQEVFRLLEKIAPSESTVLIHGESGTGKELVARAIHFGGPRSRGAFVVQNCSAFNDNLLESALFGHTKGSFTGAVKDQKGLFEIADNGTFFLDEVGDMSPALQVKLLRVLQEGTFTPVGSTETREVDVRVIAASHKDLHALVKRGEFREDLYYRINVIKVSIPPLRARIEDLDLLVDHFLHKHTRRKAARVDKRTPRLSPAALAVMRRYAWPGNIRELENEIERLLVLGAGLDELPEELLSPRLRETAEPEPAPTRAPPKGDDGTLRSAVEAVEREIIHQGLIRTHWNKSLLAKELGISRSNLIAKVERYGLERK